MIKRFLLVGFVLLTAMPLVRGADEPVRVPEGVRYKPASEKVNDAAKDVLRKRFTAKASDADAIALFGDGFLICGPGLWAELKSDESLAKLKNGRVNIEVPVVDKNGKVIRKDKLEGKLFQTKDELLLFWKVFIKRTDLSGIKIRKLNTEELKLFWAMISFDITEPLFVLETKKHRVVVCFKAPDELKVVWMDDLQNLVRKEEK
jgi:hypothetical protein